MDSRVRVNEPAFFVQQKKNQIPSPCKSWLQGMFCGWVYFSDRLGLKMPRRVL